LEVRLADLRAQYYELKDQIDAAIVSVIESGQFSDGPRMIELEERIAETCGATHGIAVASGTDALVLSLVACGIGTGDEVITTPFTFAATTEALALLGAKAIYVDIDSCTFNIDPARIEEKVTPRTRAILPVDLYGQMADRLALVEIARRYDLRLIIDSAQAIGARQNGQPIAVHGDTTTLSFYPTKNLGAYGDGGMVLTNDAGLAEELRSLRNHGTRHQKYLYERVGYCSRLDTIQAVVLLAKLPRLREWNEGRRRNAARYHALLADLTKTTDLVLPQHDKGNYHIYHQYTIQHPRRDDLQKYLKQHGVETAIYYPLPVHLQPAYAYLGYREGDFPIAERAAREVLSLPVHPELTEAQIEYVAATIRRFLA